MPPSEPSNTQPFFDACAGGDVDTLRTLLAREPGLVRQSDPRSRHAGWSGLHASAKAGQPEVVRLLLQEGADPNAREAGDNTSPLFWAAAAGDPETVRLLLDAGADATATGDAHELGVIGWGSVYQDPGEDGTRLSQRRRDVLTLLVDAGAKHHIFSAIAAGDLDLVRQVAQGGTPALDRRMSVFEGRQTPLQFAINRRRYDILGLLIELGADLNMTDESGQTAMTAAMLRDDRQAMAQLSAAGAEQPAVAPTIDLAPAMAALAGSVGKVVPMLTVPDVAATLDWYVSIGFREVERYTGDDGLVNFGMAAFGNAELMLNMHGTTGPHDVTLWFYTDRVDQLYELLTARQLAFARGMLEGGGRADNGQRIEFEQGIADMFYGARQFSIRDPNGFVLYFIQPIS
jgi:ankyrin repeat protein/catechol 2,3-dioxygenase-like lactoylglutathione lyase family enzyme